MNIIDETSFEMRRLDSLNEMVVFKACDGTYLKTAEGEIGENGHMISYCLDLDTGTIEHLSGSTIIIPLDAELKILGGKE